MTSPNIGPRSPADRFFSIHTHGFCRVAACTPRGSAGDPEFNTDETLALVQAGHEQAVDLMVFPELGISSYAIDDLHLQDALLNAVDTGLQRLVDASRSL